MNEVVLMGRLTSDPVVDDDATRATYTLAVDRRGTKDEADFIPCVVFGKGAEVARDYLHKGEKLLVSGHIRVSSYKRDGQTVYRTNVVVDAQEFCESKRKPEAEKNDPEFKPIPER